jgi:hypothetical protein
MSKFGYRTPVLALTLVGGLALAGCGDYVTGVDEHGDAAGVELVMNGVVVATFSFASNTWTGEMEVQEGEETPHISVDFVDADGDVIVYDADFYLDVDVEDELVAEFEQDTPGEFAGHLHGVSVGETDVTFSLMHGTIGSGHADLVTAPVPANVVG